MSGTQRLAFQVAGTAAMVTVAAVAGGLVFAEPSESPPGPQPQPAFTLPTTPLADHLVVTKKGSAAAGSGTSFLTVYCPSGYVVTGGGESNSGLANRVYLTDSYPVELDGKNGWKVWAYNSSANAADVVVYAVCQKVPT